ncbi:MAG: hypothetical protein JO219_03670 [Candidatus Eremiobacteraeota bacterium]|nr:hypothetical protein [Candidatus Eremiobacteraeota bacterium]
MLEVIMGDTGPLRDLTPAFKRYRECARHVWNAYFVDFAFDAQHDFNNVDGALFVALVLAEFQVEPARSRGYYESIIVKYNVPPKGLPILFPAKLPDAVQWCEATLHSADAEFRFIDFWDWDVWRSNRDFEFVRLRAVAVPERPDLNGLELLIEPTYLTFVADERLLHSERDPIPVRVGERRPKP